MADKMRTVCSAFGIPGELVSWDRIKQGNINSTYKVMFRQNGALKLYLVQKVNVYVFKEPVSMMNNIGMVTEHICSKLKEEGVTDPRRFLRFLKAEDGNNYLFLKNGKEEEFWRVCNFIEDSVTFDDCSDYEVLRMSGKAFGRFEMYLGDFDASTLVETIPDFHDTEKRLDKFFADLAEDPCGRASVIAEEAEEIRKYRELGCSLVRMQKSGQLPLRVTHNDTKTNNVMYDEDSLEPLVVVDLDTVMSGLAAYDFGDACRFACNTASEDEKDPELINFDMNRFKALAEGFVSETKTILTQKELDTLALGAAVMTLELAVRFLDDYITGDKYFRIQYPEHNLVRGKCQLSLFNDIMAHMEEMEQVIRELE